MGDEGGVNDVVSADLELLGIQHRGYSFAFTSNIFDKPMMET